MLKVIVYGSYARGDYNDCSDVDVMVLVKMSDEEIGSVKNEIYDAAFYAVKSVLVLEEVDFKRHKNAVAYFNKTYVATEIFSKEIGKRLERLKQERESSDYDDFYMASASDATKQFETAKMVVCAVENYLTEKGIKRNEK